MVSQPRIGQEEPQPPPESFRQLEALKPCLRGGKHRWTIASEEDGWINKKCEKCDQVWQTPSVNPEVFAHMRAELNAREADEKQNGRLPNVLEPADLHTLERKKSPYSYGRIRK